MKQKIIEGQFDIFGETYKKPEKIIKGKDEPTVISDKEVTKAVATLTKRIEAAQKKADGISMEISGNWTHKRQGELDSRKSTKYRIEKKIKCLNTILCEWQDYTIHKTLMKVRSLNDIDVIVDWGYPKPLEGDEMDHYIERYNKQIKSLKRLGIENLEDSNKATELLVSYATVTKTPEEIKKEKLDKAISELRGQKIPGFFPTPDELIEEMFDFAKMYENTFMEVLEPSAGIGHIADKVVALKQDHNVTCVEIRPALCNILELKGYHSVCSDILETPVEKKFDRIIMNPPFEKGQDMEHIMHCAESFLKPNGILVSVASSGIQHNTAKKFVEFREWLSEREGEFIEVDQGSFKGAFNSTGVSVCLVVIGA